MQTRCTEKYFCWSGKRENKLLTVSIPSLYLELCEEEGPPSLLQPPLGSGTLQAGETYGNVILLLLGKNGALGLRNEPRA